VTKDELIRKLEGRIITTADKRSHLVKDGEYRTRAGTVKLAGLSRFILEAFFVTSREE
jgi:hypothetical protein